MYLFFKLWYRIKIPMSNDSVNAPHQLNIMYHADPKNDMIQALKSREKRISLMDVGIHSANVFIDNKRQHHFTEQSETSDDSNNDIQNDITSS